MNFLTPSFEVIQTMTFVLVLNSLVRLLRELRRFYVTRAVVRGKCPPDLLAAHDRAERLRVTRSGGPQARHSGSA